MQEKVIVIVIVFLLYISPLANAGVMGDIDADQKVGISEVLYGLQVAAGIRAAANTSDVTLTSSFVDAIGADPFVLLSVPADKEFILTDLVAIIFSGGSAFYDFCINEDTTCKLKYNSYYNSALPTLRQMHLNAGVPFTPGSTVFIKNINGTGRIVISGYLKSTTSQIKQSVKSSLVDFLENKTVTVLQVPSDKVFILTDIIGYGKSSQSRQTVCINENAICKFKTRFEFLFRTDVPEYSEPQKIHFNAGIPFASESTISIQSIDGWGANGTGFGSVFISGYLISGSK